MVSQGRARRSRRGAVRYDLVGRGWVTFGN